MLISLLAAAWVLISVQDAPAADPEAAGLAELHARATKRCETDLRVNGETIEACARRRAAAMLGTYGSTPAALAATVGWAGTPTTEDETIDLSGAAEMFRSAPLQAVPATPVQASEPVRRPRCRRETIRNEDGSSTSTTIICGNGRESDRAAREALDRLMQPSN